MEYLLGALIMAAFFVCLYGAYIAGQKSRKPTHREVDDQEVNKAKEIRKGFEQLMSYDVSKATGKKVR